MGERIHRFFDHNEKNQRLGEDWDPHKKLPSEPHEAKPQLHPQGAMARPPPGVSGSTSRLFLSLLSGLPNEQEFALGVCSLLTANDRTFPLTPRMLDALVAQAGVWRQEDRELYLESWQGVEGRHMHLFWRTTLHPHAGELSRMLGMELGVCSQEDEFWNLESDPGSLEAEGHRVLKVAYILHNLSFEKDNVSVLVNSTIFIRFLLLSIHSSWANLKQTAFDTLANIASELRLVEGEGSSVVLLRVVLAGLGSEDRFATLRSMDSLAQLCGNAPNDQLIPPLMDTQMYERMVSFLTVHDIMLLFYTLEALYALSDLGKTPCDRIACVHGSIGVLVSLLTLDPGQYGPSAEIKMKLFEILVPAEPGSTQNEPVLVQAKKPATVTITPSEATVVPTPTTSVVSKEVNSETFASNWLKGQYEMFPGSLVSRNEIYAEYVGFCAKAERKGVVNANVFANCIKICFPQVELKKVQSSGGAVTFHHDGLRKKRASNLPLIMAKDPNVVVTCAPIASKPPQKPLQSPILQAQLSAPAKPTEIAAKPPMVTIAPHTSSTLIKSLLANKVHQRAATPVQRHVVPVQQRQVFLGGLQKMVIFSSPGGKAGQGVVRCVVPSLQGARFVAAPPQMKVVPQPPPQINGDTAVCSKTSGEVSTPILQMNCVQNNVSIDSSSAKDLLTSEVSSSPQPPKDVQVGTSSDQNFILQGIQGNTITYRLAGPEELSLSTGNRLFLGSKTPAEATEQQNGNGTIFLNNKKVQPPFIQPKATPDVPKVIVESKRKEDICKKSPLLNGLLDKGRQPSGDILFNALVENGIEASDVGLEMPKVQSLLLPQVKRSNSVVSSLNSFILPASSTSESFVLKSEESSESKSISQIPTSTVNSILLPSQSPSQSVIFQSQSTLSSPVVVPCPNGSNLVQIRSGQSTFSGTAELQSDQTGVVRLHIESPENSNQGSSDLSSISDIARTLECASEAISRTNAECNTQVPRTPVTFAVSTAAGSVAVVASNVVGQGVVAANVVGQQNSPLTLNSVVSNIIGGSTLAVNPLTGNIIGQGAAALAGNIIRQNRTATLSLNSAGNIISQGGAITLNSAGNIIGQGGTLSVNSAGNIISHGGTLSVNSAGNIISQALSVNSAGNIIGQGGTLSVNSAGNILGQGGTLSVNSAGNIISQGGTLSVNSAGNIISQGGTIAVNSLAGSLNATVNTVTGGIAGQSRPNQQIFVVTSPGQMSQQNLQQLQMQSPNIKFCILHTVPVAEESGDASQTHQDTPPSPSPLKRAAASEGESGGVAKKPRLDTPVQLATSIPGCEGGDRPSTPKVTTVPAPTASADPPSAEAKTFSGLTSASDLPASSVPAKPAPSAKLEFICEWKGCGLKFCKPGHVFLHASRVHTPASADNTPCLWEGCDAMKRRRFSLLTHLQDWHCNERVLQLQAARRQQVGREGSSSLPPPPKPPPHPGYAPDAAVLAIKRHALQYDNPKELAEEKESPLTKSIRLTSALILRNLVMHSSLARTYVRRFEAELAYLAMSPVESAKAIAHCLALLSTTPD